MIIYFTTTVIGLVKCFLWSGQIKNGNGGHMAHMGERRSAYTALVEKSEGTTWPGSPSLFGRTILVEL